MDISIPSSGYTEWTKRLLRFIGRNEILYFVSDDSIEQATLIKTKIKIFEYQIHKTTKQQI